MERALLTVLYLFFAGSISGWTLELFYRRFITARRWLNPGFLVGPCLPLYGFSLCALYLLAQIDFSFVGNAFLREVLAVLLMGVSITLIEYFAGLIFIHGLKVKLWDYSDQWGNLQGIICPLYSFFWTLLAAAYRFFLHPAVSRAVEAMLVRTQMLFVLGMLSGILLVDVCWSFQLLARIRTFAKENHIVVRLEEFKRTIAEHAGRNRFIRFLFALQEKSRSTAELLQDYLEALRNKRRK